MASRRLSVRGVEDIDLGAIREQLAEAGRAVTQRIIAHGG